jgi:hypothetical protein
MDSGFAHCAGAPARAGARGQTNLMEPRRIHLRPLILLVAAGLALVFAPLSVAAWVALGAVGLVSLIGYFMSSSLQWVELDGGVIRARRLLTRTLVERPVVDIVDARPLHPQAMGPLEHALMDALLKTTNRGYEIRFRDGTKLGLVRGEMAGPAGFLGALAMDLARQREGDRTE